MNYDFFTFKPYSGKEKQFVKNGQFRLLFLAVVLLLDCPIFTLYAQTVIGGLTPDPSAMLDVQSTAKGVLFPRMTTGERNAISSPVAGLMIFNTTTVCLEINLGTPASPAWQAIKCLGSITSLNCAGAALTGSLIPNVAASGVSVSVPYAGGNGGLYDAQTITSTGVTGLTATLSGGSLASGSGNLSYAITGTPSGTGTASFSLNIGGQSCALNLMVQVPISVSCTDAIRQGEMQPNVSYFSSSGVTLIVPYTGGTGAAYTGETVSSTGVTGFTATLSAGNFATGSGNLSYQITGTGVAGTATFALTIAGSSCSVALPVELCRAKINATDFKTFQCYNLGVYSTLKSYSMPSWEINGGYWRWGVQAEAAAGPTGSSFAEANNGTISGWNTLPVGGNSAWVDVTKTASDPCPAGFRIPTKDQWQGVITNNVQSNVGGTTWTSGETNYATGKNFGSNLFLPVPGLRMDSTGGLVNRGSYGYYWSSTEDGTDAWGMRVFDGSPDVNKYSRASGFSVRCIAE